MVKQLQFKMVLLLGILLAGVSSVWAEDNWVLTDPTDLVSGDIVAIVDQTSSRAMSNNKGTSNAPVATEITLTTDKDEITGIVANTLQWEVTVTTTDNVRSYQFGVSGTSNYLYTTTSNNGLRVGPSTTNSHNVCGISTNDNVEYITINDGSNTRYIGVYNNQDWRSYTSVNSNIKNTVTAFYKKVSDGRTDIAAIGTTLTPTEVYVGDIDNFNLAITYAENTTEDDYIVVWESSDSDILEFADETYEAKAAGQVTVTVSVIPDDTETYNEVSRTFTVTVIDPNGPGTANNPYTVAQAKAAIDAGTGITGVYVKGVVCTGGSNLNNGAMNYWISDDGTETNKFEVYKGKGINGASFTSLDDVQVGDEVIVYGNLKKYNSTYEFDSGNYIVSIISKPNPELSFGETTSFTCDLMLTFAAPELSTAEGFDGEVTYASSDPTVATVNAETGVVTLVAVGTTTITASTTGSETYSAGSASYTLEVTIKSGVDPVGPSGTEGEFVKVTDTDDITEGEYLIVYETDGVAFDGSLETLDVGNNVINVTFEADGTITETTANKAAVFTINPTNGTVKSASGYYIGISSYSNGLKTTDDDNNPFITNSLSIDGDGNLLITKTFDGGTMSLLFNSSSGDTNYRFRFYKNASATVKPIQLYKYVPGTSAESFDVTISEYGYKTLVSTVPFSTPEGVTAYIVTESSTTDVTLAPITEVPAGEPVILKGDAGDVTLTVLEEAEDVTGNLLKVADATTGNGVYVLAKKNGNVGFYMWNGGSLGAGRVYIDAPTAGARQFLSFNFGGETTGIAEMEDVRSKMDGSVFDLQGRRVSKPTKGLYIVNGKKIIK